MTQRIGLGQDRTWERMPYCPLVTRERVWPMVKRTLRRRAKGFTMVEIVIVLTISVVLVAIVMPSLVASLGQRATRGAVHRLTATHSLARATAVRFGRVAELHIDAANARFWVEVDTSGTGIRDTVGLMNDLSEEQITMSSNRSLLCFDSRGLTTTRNACESGDALVQFSVGGHTDTFQTTVLGKVLR